MRSRLFALSFLAAALLATPLLASSIRSGFTKGTPDLQSAGPLAFAPEGVLLVGDTKGAAVFAIDTGDTSGKPEEVSLNIEGLGKRVAAALGTQASDILINDLAVNPASGTAYLSVSRGRGPDATPVLLRINAEGKLSELSLKDVRYAKAELPNPPAPGGTGRRNSRAQSITDLEFVDGQVVVAGLSNEEFASNLRTIPFPFKEADRGTGIEIFHGSHGRLETRSPVRTFAVYDIGDQPHLLAAYTCTPLVKLPLKQLKPGAQVRGTTIAELGNRNRPYDMVVYQKGDDDFILIANSSRGVMKVTTKNIEKIAAITDPVRGTPTAGLPYETIEELKGVVQLDRLNKDHALLLVQTDDGTLNLRTIEFP